MTGRIHRFGRTDSTNERAFEAIAAKRARDGDAFVALEQTAGRGRLGRRWESAPGEGLYVSYVHLPETPARPIPPPAITMAAGLAVLDAVRALGLSGARLDWPNDIVVGEAKLAGILVESRGLDPAAPHFVIGIGVNVAQRSFSEELRRERAVTSLALEGSEHSPDELLETLLPRLEERLRQANTEHKKLTRDYLEGTGLAGALITLQADRGTVTGTLLDIDLTSGIRIEGTSGAHTIDLAHVRGLERQRS